MTAIVTSGDAAHLLLPDATVDLIVTSPPYFRLRSYQDGGEHYVGQIGREATPAEYLDALISCTAEWARVLKPGGSIFLNMGDAYSKNKSLRGLPWRYAIRCIDELDLILRAEIVWAKPNGLPESATDRVRRSHEQVFHFVKQPRYYSAVDEVREQYNGAHGGQAGATKYIADGYAQGVKHGFGASTLRTEGGANPLGKLPGSVWSIPTAPLRVPESLGIDHFAAYPPELVRRIVLGWSPKGGTILDPFGGTGTTALVASVLGRVGISVDLSADYCRLARWRTTDEKQRAKAAGVKPKKPKPAKVADVLELPIPASGVEESA